MIIKKPGKGHTGFRLLNPKAVRDKEIDAINAEYRAGRLSLADAHTLVKARRDQLNPKPKPKSYYPQNEALAQAYWEARVKPKDLKNRAPEEARRRVFWAIRALGSTPLLSTTVEGLAAAISHLNAKQQYRCSLVLNAVMRWKGLDKALYLKAPMREDPPYITLDELMSFSLVRKEWQLCVYAAFATGARYAELFSITPTSFQEGGSHVYIRGQMKPVKSRPNEWTLAVTKNNQEGAAYIAKDLRQYVREWAKVPTDVKMAMRRAGYPAKQFKLLALKALGRDVTFHHLRHSYVRYWLQGNEGQFRDTADLKQVAAWIRDRQSTVDTHYRSWAMTTSDMRAAVKRWG